MNPNIENLIVGNWKMNGTKASLAEVERLDSLVKELSNKNCSVAICPPATLVAPMCNLNSANVAVGGQNCHANTSGAHTGDVSAEMLADAGAQFVIVGHSERRADCGETDADVSAKAIAAFRAKITPIICIGETKQEREDGLALKIVGEQLAASIPDEAANAGFVVAYEPVWAIGTGLIPSMEDIAEVHGLIREQLIARFGDHGARINILYGGSMKPSNAAEILAVPHVNGGLIGGASLKADDLITIIRAA